jgi:hypothetical protein
MPSQAQFGVRLVRHSKYVVTSGKALHSGPGFDYHSREIHSNNPWKPYWHKIFGGSGTPHQVKRVDASGNNPYQYFTRSWNRVGIVFELQFLWPAVFVNHNCFHCLLPFKAAYECAGADSMGTLALAQVSKAGN